jgi:hypothetical protein
MATPLPLDFTGHVYWIGYVREGPSLKAPTVDVILSNRPISERSQSNVALKFVKVDVGAAGLLYIGSNWFRGRRRHGGILDVHRAEIDADADKIRVVKADEALKGGTPILDVAHYALPSWLKNTRLLVFHGSTVLPVVVIPTWEIARYFFCRTSVFARSIFEGTILLDDGTSRCDAAMARFDGVKFGSRRLASTKSSPGSYAWRQAQAITLRAAALFQVEREHVVSAFPPTKERLEILLSGIALPEIGAFLGLRIASARERGTRPDPKRNEVFNEIRNIANALAREQ